MARESRATTKVMGIEDEFGVMRVSSGALHNPCDAGMDFFYASHRDYPLRMGGYGALFAWHRSRDFQEKLSLANDPYLFQPRWVSSDGFFLENGARYYLDHAHPEMDTCTVHDPKSLVTWHRASYRLVDEFRKKIAKIHGVPFRVFANNVGAHGSDKMQGKIGEYQRNSYGTHLNMLISRHVSTENLIRKSIPFFVFLTQIVGQGKMRSDFPGHRATYQISQRADFIERVVGFETTHLRSIVNERDEPHGNWEKWRRHHIILFDANMLELPEYLKAGLVAIHHMMLEDEALDDRFDISDPVGALHQVSWDTTCRVAVRLENQRRTRRVVDCLRDYADLFWEYLEAYHPHNRILKDVVIRFRDVLDHIAAENWEELFGKLDWLTKKMIIEEKLARAGKTWDDPRADLIDLQYSEIDMERGLFWKSVYPMEQAVRIAKPKAIEFAAKTPYPGRSRFMAELCRRYGKHIHYLNFWSHVVADYDRAKMVYLDFDNPAIQWHPRYEKELFSLPWKRFLKKLARSRIARVSHRSFLEHETRESEGPQGKELREEIDRLKIVLKGIRRPHSQRPDHDPKQMSFDPRTGFFAYQPDLGESDPLDNQ